MLQFFTRLPLPFEIQADAEDFNKGFIWFTAVGLVIGGLLAILCIVLSPFVGTLLLAVILVLAEVLLTGGLHLDGLSDTFDGLYSNRDKERVLEIMKDSRIGANGALAMMSWLLLKIALLNELFQLTAVHAPKTTPWLVLLLMPVAAKSALALSCYLGPYARKEGMGHLFIGKVSVIQLFPVLTLAAILHALLVPASLAVWAGILLLTLAYTRHVRKRIDGLTGDTLGAWHELSELFYLAGWLAMIQIL
jgi:adenosylcobinamide-GDP ribazoletransferase